MVESRRTFDRVLLSQCLRDNDLPVQIEAASSLRYLIELDEAEEPVLAVLPDILNEYFRIMQEIGLDDVSWRRDPYFAHQFELIGLLTRPNGDRNSAQQNTRFCVAFQITAPSSTRSTPSSSVDKRAYVFSRFFLRLFDRCLKLGVVRAEISSRLIATDVTYVKQEDVAVPCNAYAGPGWRDLVGVRCATLRRHGCFLFWSTKLQGAPKCYALPYFI